MSASWNRPPQPYRGFEHIKRYWDTQQSGFIAKIMPGEYYVTAHSECITTVLGSCVAACVRDPEAGVGGMNHFMLPADDRPETGLLSDATRYGNYAMEHLINDILKHGGQRQRLELKIFGGAAVMERMSDIGALNIRFVREFCQTERLTIAAQDLGGDAPRKVYYYPKTGRVSLKRLKSLAHETLVERERHYLEQLKDSPLGGDVELFE